MGAVAGNLSKIAELVFPARADVQIDEVDIVDYAEAPFVDITLRNAGDRVASINSVEFEILRAAEGREMSHPAGVLEIDWKYDVVIELGETLPFVVDVPNIARKLEKDDVERVRVHYKFDFPMSRKHEVMAFAMKVKVRYNSGEFAESEVYAVDHSSLSYFKGSLFRFGFAPPLTEVETRLGEARLTKIGSLDGRRTVGLEKAIEFGRSCLQMAKERDERE
jgi:hypothetical protein